MEKQLEKINKAANNYNKTKDLKYKDQWYKLIKEFASGFNNTKRWNIPTNTCNK